MDIVYKNRWGIYLNGERVLTYWNKQLAKYMKDALKHKYPLSRLEVRQIKWLEE
ncbi:hypothetical protein RVS70_05255 [Virgibacillus sp. M23]|uniref:hypothetical protein n=1 Tax=Virgibacillus sp. M23 TaxID=3079030 RepID=UPI002A91964A|nr:hypothetical protein [Virgibacillus sp. M23]MDY7043608.1 hypothetical protein [Virgibacillus sp. M23]